MKAFILSALVLVFGSRALAQRSWPFEKEIKNFEKQDSLAQPKKQQILFIGSSSIRLWTDLLDRFKEFPVLQRGFGGGELSDVTHFASRILIPYRPSKIFLYAGENDIAKGQSAEQVFNEFVDLFKLINTNLPETQTYFISAKPSPRRKDFKNQLEEFNNRVKTFIEKQHCNWAFIDVYHAMLGPSGTPPEDIFIADKLHMNSKGYDIWEQLIRQRL